MSIVAISLGLQQYIPQSINGLTYVESKPIKRGKIKVTEIKPLILDLMSDGEEWTVNDFNHELGIAPHIAKHHLNFMVDKGILSKRLDKHVNRQIAIYWINHAA